MGLEQPSGGVVPGWGAGAWGADDLDQFEGCGPAVRTAQGGRVGWAEGGIQALRVRWAGGAQELAHVLESGLALAIGQQTVVTDLDEALGQQVQTEATEELCQRQGQGFDPVGVGVVLVGEGDGLGWQIQALEPTGT